MIDLLVFVLGAVVGSFLNVCIRRVPEGESIVSPGSYCPSCDEPIRFYDNVPLLSYLALRGRCRNCRGRISSRYPLVELLTAALFWLVYRHTGLHPELLLYATFAAALVTITFIDLDHQIIPDVISLPGIVVGLTAAALGYGIPVRDSAIGLLIGGGFLYAVAAGYELLTQREGMGGGDIKLLAMIGAFLGWRGVLVTLLVGSSTGAAIGIALMVMRGADTRLPIPFGPFLSLGALVALFHGEPLLEWYAGLSRW
ncbi:MAG TPA: A24 family peptidase [Terriglobales bacterium]|nr:A24 family peptidase [Terriglobales bacterium]